MWRLAIHHHLCLRSAITGDIGAEKKLWRDYEPSTRQRDTFRIRKSTSQKSCLPMLLFGNTTAVYQKSCKRLDCPFFRTAKSQNEVGNVIMFVVKVFIKAFGGQMRGFSG